MATKKSTPGTKTARGKAKSTAENSAPNPTVEPVNPEVNPSVQVAASTNTPEGKVRQQTQANPEPKSEAPTKTTSETNPTWEPAVTTQTLPGGKTEPQKTTPKTPESKLTPSPARPEASNDTAIENRSEPGNKMFEVRKPEPRKNVIPINLEEEIRRRAYELFVQRQPGSGSEAEDWLNAEREVMQRYHQQSA